MEMEPTQIACAETSASVPRANALGVAMLIRQQLDRQKSMDEKIEDQALREIHDPHEFAWGFKLWARMQCRQHPEYKDLLNAAINDPDTIAQVHQAVLDREQVEGPILIGLFAWLVAHWQLILQILLLIVKSH